VAVVRLPMFLVLVLVQVRGVLGTAPTTCVLPGTVRGVRRVSGCTRSPSVLFLARLRLLLLLAAVGRVLLLAAVGRVVLSLVRLRLEVVLPVVVVVLFVPDPTYVFSVWCRGTQVSGLSRQKEQICICSCPVFFRSSCPCGGRGWRRCR
jgi:hypothetical protein